MSENAKNQINGTYGSVWLDSELFSDVDSFEAKINIDYEDVNMSGDPATHKKMKGWNGDGKLTVKKIYSRGVTLLAEKVADGETATFKIVGKLADPDALGNERVSISEVTFSEFTLMKFEQKTLGTEELPFAFASYEIIDSIES
jgi:hypothetical protein